MKFCNFEMSKRVQHDRCKKGGIMDFLSSTTAGFLFVRSGVDGGVGGGCLCVE